MRVHLRGGVLENFSLTPLSASKMVTKSGRVKGQIGVLRKNFRKVGVWRHPHNIFRFLKTPNNKPRNPDFLFFSVFIFAFKEKHTQINQN